MADLVVDGVTFRRNLFSEWCQVSDESGELHIAWQESSCLDEIERLRAERDAERDRSCVTCLHGYVHPRYPIDEVGVRCERIRTVFWMPFHCSKWEARRG